MISFFRHSRRFVIVIFALARYGAFGLVNRADVPFGVRLLVRLMTLPIPRKRGLPKDMAGRLVAAFNALGPAYVKLGQMLSTRPDVVGDDLARGLRRLQDDVPAFSPDEARAVIEEDFGRSLESVYAEFDSEPVAAASIAQVHRATTQDGMIVAVKVLRPGIRRKFERDLDAFLWGAGLIERHIPRARRLRPVDVVHTVIESVRQEMDLRLEAAAASELADNMAGEAGYYVPRVEWQLTTERVMTIEWIDGISLSDKDALTAAGHDHTALAHTVVRVFLKQAMRDGFFHADLHQGNLLVAPDGTLVAIDFGIMGRLDRASSRFLAEILYGFLQKDYRAVADCHFRAGYVPPNRSREQFAQALRAIAEPIMDRPVAQISAGNLLAQLFATTATFEMETQPQLLMLQRTMVMVEGMALHLDPKANMWEISRPTIESWIAENLSPEIQFADFILENQAQLRRLPALADKLITLVDALEEDGVRIHPDSQQALKNQPRQATSWIALVAAALIGLGIGLGLQ